MKITFYSVFFISFFSVYATPYVIDGHNDLPWALRSAGDLNLTLHNLNQFQPKFHTDIPRLRQGNVGAQFWSVYVPSRLMQIGGAKKMTLEQIGIVKRMMAKYPDAFEQAFSSEDIRRIKATGKIASMIGMEGGHSIENSIENLRELYRAGARYMTLSHDKNLSWVESCTDKEMANPLTSFGEEVVREMNRLGMLVDISHISARAMRKVLDVTQAPVIASHSSAYAVTPHVRNVPDDVLLKVKQNGGVVMVNFYSEFITSNGKGTVSDVVDHIEHIIKVAGIDHVGLGSDFDGVPELPEGLEDASKYPNLEKELLKRGHSEDEIKKIFHENLLRVFEKIERVRDRKV